MYRTRTEDGSATLFSPVYKQTFHSSRGALQEARHVFLEASGVLDKLTHGEKVQVLEVGFGTGLNFFVSADAALKAGTLLSYTALERELLMASVVGELGYKAHLEHPELVESYLTFRSALPETVPGGVYKWRFGEVRLELLVGEATERTFIDDTYDAVYQDAFSPDANPELWTESFFEGLYRALESGGVLVSYSVKGEVRRRLQRVGFEIHKRPGPLGGKREMLWVCKTDRPRDV